MPRYFMYLAYKGTNYHGWQRQPNAISVQEIIEKHISILLKEKVEIVGVGRTDTGVHAKSYVAHFDIDFVFDKDRLCYQLNRLLPVDVVIYKILHVKDHAHARYSALSRTYKYYIITQKDPFQNDFAWHIHYTIDIDQMIKATNYLIQITDFTSFIKLHSNNTNNICQLYHAYWEFSPAQFVFTITANRFLRNMVRAIVGNIIDVGRRKISVNDFIQRIVHKDRSLASTSAPAKGLFLTNIEYPSDIFI